MGPKVLIVDDDTSIRTALEVFLRDAGYEPFSAPNAAEGLRLLYSERPALVLLDVVMPGMDGWEMAARIRELSDVPLIIISGRDTESDKLRGFRLGADDYVTKPFSLVELGARIGAVLARAAKSVRGHERRQYLFSDLTIDLDRHRVMRGDQVIDMTPTEFRLLQVLVEKAGDAVSETQLHESVWGNLRQHNAGYVRRYIWFLRQKLERDPTHPELIHTVRKFGYRFGPE
ncbi:MAG TPA: response regulator transcription factor [Anaerolineae bacterium]|nr:response regulator transcription factor [Anaerolineae bacterium]